MDRYINNTIFLGNINDYKSSEDFINYILIHYFNMEIKEFIRSKNGKPLFLNSDLFFSISHKKQFISAIFSNESIGLDMEIIRPYPHKVAKRFFNKDEVYYIDSSQNKDLAFFKIWTAKEAFIKENDLNLSFITSIDYFKIKCFSFFQKNLVFSVSGKCLNSNYIIENINI